MKNRGKLNVITKSGNDRKDLRDIFQVIPAGNC